MRNFTMYNPTRIEFGKGKENHIGEYMKQYGVKKALIVYGSERIKKSGLFGRATASLTENGIDFSELGGVKSNPVISKAREGGAIAKKNSIDAVLAIGGGSVLDTGKVIAAGAVYEGDVWDLCTLKKAPAASLRIFDILTLSATGSEMNNTAIITNEETTQKLGFSGPYSFPTVSIINPELQSSVTNAYLAYSAVDIFAHCLDLYFTAAYVPEFTVRHIENILKTVIRTTDILLESPNDYEARGEFAWAAAQALNQTTKAGVEGNRIDTHVIEHSLSALYDVPHGAGLAIVLPAWMRWHLPMNKPMYERFAKNVFGAETAEEGINAMKSWIIRIGAPVTLAEENISKDDVNKISEHVYCSMELFRMQVLYSKEMLVDILNRML